MLGFGVDPTANDPAVRKHQNMRSVVVKDGQFKFAVKGRSGYRFPLHTTKCAGAASSP